MPEPVIPDISPQQLRAFARDGYIVVSQVVSSGLIDAARRAIADRAAHDPPRAGHRGPLFDFVVGELPRDLAGPLFDCATLALAESLIAPASFERPDHVQVSLNIPPWPHEPGGPHIDGLTPPEPDGRPGTFTMLAGIFLTDQSRENAGNLWVWPGSHLAAADYLRHQGPDALLSCVPYPPVELGQPRQVTARPGDVLFAHYLLGHNIGGNISEVRREVLYFRLRRTDHRARWRQVMQEPLLEFEPVRAALDGQSRP